MEVCVHEYYARIMQSFTAGLLSIKKCLEAMLAFCDVVKVQLGREDRECLVLLVGQGR